jgi:signal transduction histidine kinase
MRGTIAMRSRILSTTPKRKLTVWKSSLFRVGLAPVLRTLLGDQLAAFSTTVRNRHLGLYLRERGHLLLLLSMDTGDPPSYHNRILLTQVWESLESANGWAVVGSDSPFLNASPPYRLCIQTIALRSRKELEGVLVVFRSDDEPNDDVPKPDINPIIRTITNFLSLIALLLRERKRSYRLRLMNKISQRIKSLTDEDKLYDYLVHHIQRSFDYDHVAIYLVEKENKSLQLKAMAGQYSRIVPKDQVVTIDQGIVGWVATYGKTLISNQARQDPHFLNKESEKAPTEAELCVPIRVNGKIIGVLNIEHSELLYFDEDDINSVELLTDLIGVAIRNARLYSELRKSQKTLEAIASSVGYGLMMIDRDFHVQWVNRTFSKWGFEKTIGSPCHLFLNLDVNFCKNCPGSVTFRTGRISRDVLSTQSDLYYTITAIPITDSTGFVTHVLEVVEDVTSTRRTQEELEALERGLEQAQQLSSIGELAANIVHEVRNPMNAISQAIGILAADLALTDEQYQLMNVVKEECIRLNDTLNTYHLLAQKKEARQYCEGNLKSVIEKVVSLLRADQSIARRICFDVDLSDDLLYLRFDSNAMKQVFWNLLLNAVESIKEKGKISILTKSTPSHIFISIEDNGRGIEEGQLSKIFEPLYTTKRQGAGLGLTIVRRIIEDHEWKITVESAIPRGTRFTLIIPIP